MEWAHRFRLAGKSVRTTGGKLLASSWFFWVLLAVFALQAAWIALSGSFSMAYDEYFHLGVIREYATHLTPWVQDIPSRTAELGAISRDPSFLYHYLMSFPYRLLALVVHSQMVQVIVLRFINIVFFGLGIVVYRRLLLKVGLGPKLTHGVLFFFCGVPTVVMLAAQINYDNLAFLVTGLLLLFAVKLLNEIRLGTLELKDLLLFLTVLLAAGMIKYALLPVVGIVGLYVLIDAAVHHRSVRPRLVWQRFWNISQRWVKIGICIIFVLTGLLFVDRIGVNVLRYHTPAPSCDQVLSDAACRSYDPYARNAQYREWGLQSQLTTADKNDYPKQWYTQMIWESFFVVGPRVLNYPPGKPLPGGWIAGKILIDLTIVIILVHTLWLWRRSPHARLFMLVCLGYVAALYWRNYHDFLSTGIPTAIHGRYVVFIMPLLGAMAAASLRHSLPKAARPYAIIAVLILAGFLVSGGGMLPFVLRSWDAWMWPQMVDANRVLRDLLWQYIPLT